MPVADALRTYYSEELDAIARMIARECPGEAVRLVCKDGAMSIETATGTASVVEAWTPDDEEAELKRLQ